MSIYSKPLSKITAVDLQELLIETSVENIRLEFKRDVPTRDEMLKKLSSFANTYGGYVVVGAEAGNDGRISGMPGVEVQASYKQTIIQWCAEAMSPPLVPGISEPITVDGGRVCYVIFISESELAPHFLNGRRGLYIRTDEFSRRFEPKLANEQEFRNLIDRRKRVEERLSSLLSRAQERFMTFFKNVPETVTYQDFKPLPVFLSLTVTPRYPSRPIARHEVLLDTALNTSVSWRQTAFPKNHDLMSQHESVLIPGAAGPWSLLEVNIWGMLSYSAAIGEAIEHRYTGIHTPEFIGLVLVFLEHANQTLHGLGVNSSLKITTSLMGLRGIPWLRFYHSVPQRGGSSELDNDVSFELCISTEELAANRDVVAKNVLRLIFLSINWAKAADSPEKLDDLVRVGREYNLWNEH